MSPSKSDRSRILNSLVSSSIKEVFQIQLSLAVTYSATQAQVDNSTEFYGASIEFGSESIQGKIRILFPEKTIFELFTAMVGGDSNSCNEDRLMAAGEILNIIYASTRVKLNDLGWGLSPAIPVLLKACTKAPLQPWPESTTLSFQSPIGTFATEMLIVEAG